MDRSQLIQELLETRLDSFASSRILEAVPFIFGDDAAMYLAWREELAARINVDPCALLLTGSSSVGISLNPFKGLRSFTSDSDIDVAVISPRHFEEAWHHLRSLGSRRFKLPELAQEALRAHMTNYIYWGTIATDQILSFLPFAGSWVPAFDEMAQREPTRDRVINARIYRDYDSLRAYQLLSLRRAREFALTL